MLSPLRLEIDPIETGSPSWLIDEDLVKAQCRLETSDHDSDDLLQAYLRAAIEWAENTTHRTIFPRSHRWVLNCFPDDDRQRIRLPRGKTISVESIVYVSGQSSHTLSGPSAGSPGEDFQEDLYGDQGGVLMPNQSASWPSVDYDAVAPVVINFTAGWSVDEIPETLLQAILLGVSDAYDLRGSNDFAAANLADAGKALAVRELLVSPYRLSRW